MDVGSTDWVIIDVREVDPESRWFRSRASGEFRMKLKDGWRR